MNTPNPLIPQGSLDAQQYQRRSATKLVVSSILAVHGVVLGGLLFLGCDRDADTSTASNTATNATASAFDSLDPTAGNTAGADTTHPFGDLGINTNSEITIPPQGALATDTSPGATFPPMPPGAVSSFGSTGALGSTNPQLTETSTIPVESEPVKPSTYAVLPGDNFSSIAKKHKVALRDITAANPGVDSRKLKVGQVLNLPANVAAVTPAIPQDTPETGTAADLTHTVKSGDTLSKLSRDYKVSVKDIQRANNLRGSTIRVGQKLIIPGGASAGTNQ